MDEGTTRLNLAAAIDLTMACCICERTACPGHKLLPVALDVQSKLNQAITELVFILERPLATRPMTEAELTLITGAVRMLQAAARVKDSFPTTLDPGALAGSLPLPEGVEYFPVNKTFVFERRDKWVEFKTDTQIRIGLPLHDPEPESGDRIIKCPNPDCDKGSNRDGTLCRECLGLGQMLQSVALRRGLI